VTNDKIQGGSTPSHCCPNYCYQRQLTCLSLPSPSYTQLLHQGRVGKKRMSGRSTTGWFFLIFFNGCLYVYYYHGPVTLIVVPVSVPSHFIFFLTCMCLIFMTQSHTSPICINAVVIMFYDDLYVSHYHDPVTHKKSVYYHPAVLFFRTTYMCIISVAHLHSSTTRISAHLFFPNDN
jgi:hypothetical protein